MRDLALFTSSCLPLFIIAYQNWKDIPWPGIEPSTSLMPSSNSSTETDSPLDKITSFMHTSWLLAKKSLNMIEKMMDPNMIDYYIINCAIPLIITIENRYQIAFGKPGHKKIPTPVSLYLMHSWLALNNVEVGLRSLPNPAMRVHHTSKNEHLKQKLIYTCLHLKQKDELTFAQVSKLS